MSLLHTAIEYNLFYDDDEPTTVQKYSSCLEKKNLWGYTPLHLSIRYRRDKAFVHLLHHGVNVNTTDCGGDTPLHLAVDYRRVEIVRILVEFGADPMIKDYLGLTSFDIANQAPNDEIIRILKKAKISRARRNLARVLMNNRAIDIGTMWRIQVNINN